MKSFVVTILKEAPKNNFKIIFFRDLKIITAVQLMGTSYQVAAAFNATGVIDT